MHSHFPSISVRHLLTLMYIVHVHEQFFNSCTLICCRYTTMSAMPVSVTTPLVYHRPSIMERARAAIGATLIILAGLWHTRVVKNAVTKRLGQAPLAPFVRDNLQPGITTLVVLLGPDTIGDNGAHGIHLFVELIRDWAHARWGLEKVIIYTPLPLYGKELAGMVASETRLNRHLRPIPPNVHILCSATLIRDRKVGFRTDGSLSNHGYRLIQRDFERHGIPLTFMRQFIKPIVGFTPQSYAAVLLGPQARKTTPTSLGDRPEAPLPASTNNTVVPSRVSQIASGAATSACPQPAATVDPTSSMPQDFDPLALQTGVWYLVQCPSPIQPTSASSNVPAVDHLLPGVVYKTATPSAQLFQATQDASIPCGTTQHLPMPNPTSPYPGGTAGSSRPPPQIGNGPHSSLMATRHYPSSAPHQAPTDGFVAPPTAAPLISLHGSSIDYHYGEDSAACFGVSHDGGGPVSYPTQYAPNRAGLLPMADPHIHPRAPMPIQRQSVVLDTHGHHGGGHLPPPPAVPMPASVPNTPPVRHPIHHGPMGGPAHNAPTSGSLHAVPMGRNPSIVAPSMLAALPARPGLPPAKAHLPPTSPSAHPSSAGGGAVAASAAPPLVAAVGVPVPVPPNRSPVPAATAAGPPDSTSRHDHAFPTPATVTAVRCAEAPAPTHGGLGSSRHCGAPGPSRRRSSPVEPSTHSLPLTPADTPTMSNSGAKRAKSTAHGVAPMPPAPPLGGVRATTAVVPPASPAHQAMSPATPKGKRKHGKKVRRAPSLSRPDVPPPVPASGVPVDGASHSVRPPSPGAASAPAPPPAPVAPPGSSPSPGPSSAPLPVSVARAPPSPLPLDVVSTDAIPPSPPAPPPSVPDVPAPVGDGDDALLNSDPDDDASAPVVLAVVHAPPRTTLPHRLQKPRGPARRRVPVPAPPSSDLDADIITINLEDDDIVSC